MTIRQQKTNRWGWKMPRPLPRVNGAVLATAAIVAAPGLGPSLALAADQTWTFDCIGRALQYFTVPAGVTQLSAIVTGGAAGQADRAIAAPGGGGITIATMAVQPGQEFTIWVAATATARTMPSCKGAGVMAAAVGAAKPMVPVPMAAAGAAVQPSCSATSPMPTAMRK